MEKVILDERYHLSLTNTIDLSFHWEAKYDTMEGLIGGIAKLGLFPIGRDLFYWLASLSEGPIRFHAQREPDHDPEYIDIVSIIPIG